MSVKYKLALLLAAAALTTENALAGNIIITGHDTDDHNASQFMNWALTALSNNGNGTVIPAAPVTTVKVGYIGNTSPSLGSYLGFYDTFQFYNLGNASWTNAFTDNNDILIIGTGLDYVNSAGSAALNAQLAAFTTFFNGGGSLFVNSEQGLGQSFYGFIPSFGGTVANSLPGCSTETGTGACMNVTPQGTARGHTIGQIVDANITHTRFTTVDPVFEVLSIYNNSGGAGTGTAITIGLFGGIAGGGGFVSGAVPEPSSYVFMGLGLLALTARKLRRRF